MQFHVFSACRVAGLLAIGALTACTPTANDYTDSGFVGADSLGNISVAGVSARREGALVDTDGDGFGYMLGDTGGDGFVGYAGLAAGTDVTPAPTTGAVAMTGRYEAVHLSGIFLSGDNIQGFVSEDSGAVTLVADFAGRTLTGTSDDGELVVDGTFVGDDLNGSATYSGVATDLDGLVGADKAIGVFHANSGNDIVAGGFLVGR